MVTSSKKAYAIPRTTAPRAPAPTAVLFWPVPPQETPKHSSVSVSEVLWVLVSSRYVWALWASLVDIGFDSKCDFAPPAILLGLLLCPWTWDISSKLLQHGKVTAPVPTILLGLLYPWTWGISSQPLQHRAAVAPENGIILVNRLFYINANFIYISMFWIELLVPVSLGYLFKTDVLKCYLLLHIRGP